MVHLKQTKQINENVTVLIEGFNCIFADRHMLTLLSYTLERRYTNGLSKQVYSVDTHCPLQKYWNRRGQSFVLATRD